MINDRWGCARIETDGHEMYCRLCGNGGEIMECDNTESTLVDGMCPFSFCTDCICRNFGEEEASVSVCQGYAFWKFDPCISAGCRSEQLDESASKKKTRPVTYLYLYKSSSIIIDSEYSPFTSMSMCLVEAYSRFVCRTFYTVHHASSGGQSWARRGVGGGRGFSTLRLSRS